MSGERKKQQISIPALLGVACGLGVALFLLGYFSGSSKRVPVVLVTGDKTLFEDISTKYERRLSVVRVPADMKIQMTNIEGLVQLTRFKSEKPNLYSIDKDVPGSTWSEDIVIGFSDNKKTDNPIYRCMGLTTKGAGYSFYSTFANCWGPKDTGQEADFRLSRTSPTPLHIAVFSCLTPERGRYLSLNGSCENEKDSPQELLGYVRAATVLVNDSNKPKDLKKSEEASVPEGKN